MNKILEGPLFYNNSYYHGQSKLEKAAKDSGSIGHQSIYLGLIIKL